MCCVVAAGAAIFGRGNQDLVTVPLPLRVEIPDCSNGNAASAKVGLDATFKSDFAIQGRLIIDQPDAAAPIDVYAEIMKRIPPPSSPPSSPPPPSPPSPPPSPPPPHRRPAACSRRQHSC